MSEAKHTPGPWKNEGTLVYAQTEYLGEPRYHRGKLCFPDGVNRFSCCVQGGGAEAAPLREMEANARLIAAAPELLEALSDCITALKNRSNDAICDAASCGAESAIAKAEGGTAPAGPRSSAKPPAKQS